MEQLGETGILRVILRVEYGGVRLMGLGDQMFPKSRIGLTPHPPPPSNLGILENLAKKSV